MPPRYDGAADPSVFLLVYEEAVLEAVGDDKVMANWLPMALAGEPRAWLLNLPGSTVASWGELRDLFTARYVVPAHHAVAALLGGSQAPPTDRHVKSFLRQIGAASKRAGAPPGWAAPEADLTFGSGDHPASTVDSAEDSYLSRGAMTLSSPPASRTASSYASRKADGSAALS